MGIDGSCTRLDGVVQGKRARNWWYRWMIPLRYVSKIEWYRWTIPPQKRKTDAILGQIDRILIELAKKRKF